MFHIQTRAFGVRESIFPGPRDLGRGVLKGCRGFSRTGGVTNSTRLRIVAKANMREAWGRKQTAALAGLLSISHAACA